MRGAHARVGGVGRAGVWHARTIRGGRRREDPGDTWGAHATASGERWAGRHAWACRAHCITPMVPRLG